MRFKLTLLQKDKLTDYYPSVDCPYFKNSHCASFTSNIHKENSVKYILAHIDTFACEVYKNKLKLVQNSYLNCDKVYKDQRSKVRRPMQCADPDCCCKPRILLTKDLLRDICENIRSIKDIRSINEIKSICKITQIRYCIDDFKTFLILLEERKDIKLANQSFKIRFKGEHSTEIDLRTRKIAFVMNTTILPFKFDSCNVKAKGEITEVISINKVEYIVVKINWLDIEVCNFQYDIQNNFQESKYNMELAKSWKNPKDILILIKMDEIRLINVSHSSNFSALLSSNLRSNLNITYNCKSTEICDITSDLKSFPKNIKLTITDYHSIKMSSCENTNLEFWNTIIEFDNILFESNDKLLVKIVGRVEELDKKDLAINSVKILINGHEDVVCYQGLDKILRW